MSLDDPPIWGSLDDMIAVDQLASDLGVTVNWRKMAEDTPRSAFGKIIDVCPAKPNTVRAMVKLDSKRHVLDVVAVGPNTPRWLIMFSEGWESVRGTEPE